MIRFVKIEVVNPKEMRYRTVGDWYFVKEPNSPHIETGGRWIHNELNGALNIRVADTGNWLYNMLVAVHELIEVLLCQVAGITEKRVDAFDLAHQHDEDPGTHPQSPYHYEHLTAMGMEMILAAKTGVKWRVYEQALDRIYKKIPKRRKAL